MMSADGFASPATGGPATTSSQRIGPVELLQAVAIARRYYLDGKSKLDIADEFGLSRYKVARILEKALATGLVRIEIAGPAELDAGLSEELASAFALRQAIVINTPEDGEESLRRYLGHAAAQLLAEIVTDGEILGVAMGRTLSAMTAQLTRLAPCTVVQLTGVLSSMTIAESSVELVRRVSALSGGEAYPIYAPLIVSDAATAEMFRRETLVAEALRRHTQITTAVIAIGSLNPPNSTVYDALPNPERHKLRELGAQAECCAILMNNDGEILSTGLADRVIAITGEQLRNVPHVIAVAGGRSKSKAIAATLRSGLVHTLVTDAANARYLLGRSSPTPP
jgi:DNA-binding transcriptional regulator LsrR (DeoR family)